MTVPHYMMLLGYIREYMTLIIFVYDSNDIIKRIPGCVKNVAQNEG